MSHLFYNLALALMLQATAMMMPGQNHFLILSLSHIGFFKRFAAVLGIATAGLLFSSGASAAIYFSGEAMGIRIFAALGLVGSVYLFYLGITNVHRGLRNARTHNLEPTKKHLTAFDTFSSGFLVNLSNAKSILFFGSIFATTLPLASMTFPSHIFVVVLFFLNSVLIHGFVSVLISTSIMQALTQTRQGTILIVSGIFFIFFAIGSILNIVSTWF